MSWNEQRDEYKAIVQRISPLVGEAGVSIEVFADFETTAEQMLPPPVAGNSPTLEELPGVQPRGTAYEQQPPVESRLPAENLPPLPDLPPVQETSILRLPSTDDPAIVWRSGRSTFR